MEVVLEGSAGYEETVGGVEGTDGLGEGGVLVLDAVSLVDNEVVPFDLLEEGELRRGRGAVRGERGAENRFE